MIAAALLVSLCLFEAISLPGGDVRRVSLFGYRVAGDVLELEDAVRRVELFEAPEEHVPGLDVATPDEDLDELELMAEEARRLEAEARAQVAQEAAAPAFAPAPCAGCPRCRRGLGHPEPIEQLAEDAATLRQARALKQSDELPLPRAVARICSRCQGGTRRVRHGCGVCGSRGVRVWVGEREMVRTPPATEAERLAVAHALADILPELPPVAIRGARELLNVSLAGAQPATRTQALRDWLRRWDGPTLDVEVA